MSSNFLTVKYVCATCWGDLVSLVGPGMEDHVFCRRMLTGDCAGEGFVTRRYADNRRALSHLELAEVRCNYPELLGVPPESKTPEQILAELGY